MSSIPESQVAITGNGLVLYRPTRSSWSSDKRNHHCVWQNFFNNCLALYHSSCLDFFSFDKRILSTKNVNIASLFFTKHTGIT